MFTHKVAVSATERADGHCAHGGPGRGDQHLVAAKFYTAAAIISINLGILNLMPFPILDGGLILLLLIESVLRHDMEHGGQRAHLPGRVRGAGGVLAPS